MNIATKNSSKQRRKSKDVCLNRSGSKDHADPKNLKKYFHPNQGVYFFLQKKIKIGSRSSENGGRARPRCAGGVPLCGLRSIHTQLQIATHVSNLFHNIISDQYLSWKTQNGKGRSVTLQVEVPVVSHPE